MQLPKTVMATGVVAVLALTGCGGDEEEFSGPPPVVVEVSAVVQENLRDVVDLVGALYPTGHIMIKPEVAGVIKSVDFPFAEGMAFEEGAELYHLHDEEFRARLAEADAILRLKEAVYARTRDLVERQAASKADLDRAAAERDIAKAGVDLARLNVERTVVRAPWAGSIGLSLVFPGDRVDEETELIPMDHVNQLQVIFSVHEQAVGKVEQGFVIHFEVAPYPGELFEGKIFYIAPTIDFETRRLTLKALVENSNGRLKPGLFTKIRADLGERPNALMIPEAAVVYDRTGTFVWQVREDGEEVFGERVPVKLGMRLPGRVEVIEGLSLNDRVVSAGTHKVFPGVPLNPVASSRKVQPKVASPSIKPSVNPPVESAEAVQ
ncbi:MAG: efflux RND transporter periplasmic adaptor subunit [Deltaproteobacteria bacterium]|nr:efflux RND transporter periplasmic adaptor subunit [Deltaproteobacteria bacterium]